MNQRIFAFGLLAALLTSPAFAQRDLSSSGSNMTTATDSRFGDTGTTTQDIQASGSSGSGSLNAASAFSAVDRQGAVGQQSASGQGFSDVGGSTASGALGRSIGGSAGGFGGMGGFSNMFGNQSGQTGKSTQPIIRTRLRSGINVEPRASWWTEQIVAQRFRTLPSTRRLPAVEVQMDGQTAVIGGTVTNERDRRMSELLMRLEPGVRNVENRIRVAP